MATFGNTNTPFTGFFHDDTGNSQFGTKFLSAFPGGIVTDIWVYCAGDGAAINVDFCIWDGGDNLVYNSNSNTGIGPGSQSIGGQAWQHFVIPGGGVYLPSTGALRIGIWTAGHVVWTYDSSGSVNYQRVGTPSSFSSGGSEGTGNFGAYIVYTPGNANLWNGSVWVPAGLPPAYDGSSWNTGVPYVWDGSSWVQGQ